MSVVVGGSGKVPLQQQGWRHFNIERAVSCVNCRCLVRWGFLNLCQRRSGIVEFVRGRCAESGELGPRRACGNTLAGLQMERWESRIRQDISIGRMSLDAYISPLSSVLKC